MADDVHQILRGLRLGIEAEQELEWRQRAQRSGSLIMASAMSEFGTR